YGTAGTSFDGLKFHLDASKWDLFEQIGQVFSLGRLGRSLGEPGCVGVT
ncbi:hypothetical protein L195_g060712, partial [Trifolium pratense]